jgi:hypothetical protein
MSKKLEKVATLLLVILLPMPALFLNESKWPFYIWGIVSFFASLYLIKIIRQFQKLKSSNLITGKMISSEEIAQEEFSVPKYKIKVEFYLLQSRYEIESVIDSPPVKACRVLLNEFNPEKSEVVSEINWAFATVAFLTFIFFGGLSVWGFLFK